MCGITGWIDWDEDLRSKGALLRAMVDTLTPRGPDDFGVWLSVRASFAHRRLVVIDPEGGAQPMVRTVAEKTYVLCYNGELYNTSELRSELLSHGYSLQGHSDTEVLLLAFIQWGEQCLQRLNGIFAFAVWDEANQSLFMARDRLGVKPLFYAQRGSAFIFASELKALLVHPAVPPEVTSEDMAEVFYLGPARTPGHAIFHAIQELRPGYCLTLNERGLRTTRYWSLLSHEHRDDFAATVATVRELFCDAVKRQLISDVPVCTFLSGGLDSSAITALAAAHYKENGYGQLHTFSVDYNDNAQFFRANAFQPNDDSAYIQLMREYSKTDHHHVVLDNSHLAQALDQAVFARDIPGMADIDSSLLLFCRAVKPHATVALSGECADEIFGGYPWFVRPDALEADTFPWSLHLQERVNILSPELTAAIDPADYVAARYRASLDEVPCLAGADPHEARIREIAYLSMTWFMATLLERKDRMSMATGLEVRVPFCDHRLVEYVWNVPWSMKYYHGQEKGLLRQALNGLLPEAVLNRKKSPYPKTHNPAYLSLVRTRLLNILADPASPLLAWVDKSKLLQLLNSDAAASQHPWFGQLMTGPQLFAFLIQIDIWLRHYKVEVR